MLQRIWFLAVALLFSLAACSAPSILPADDAKAPDVSLAGLSFAEPDQIEQQLTVRLRLTNPNGFDIPVDALNFKLELNETSFVDGLTDKDFTLPSFGEVVIPVDIKVPTGDLVERVSAVGTGKRLPYKLFGQTALDSWFAAPVSFVREGKLALPSLPRLSHQTPNAIGTS